MTKGKKMALAAGGVAMAGIGITIATSRTQPTSPRPQHKVQEQQQHKQHKTSASQKPKPTKKPSFTPPATTPVIPSTGQSATATAQASLGVVTAKEGVTMPAGPIDIVANLANPSQHWAFAAEAAKGTSTGYTLWFGEQNIPHGPWTWIPSTLPGALSHQLPPAVYSTLQWAFDLHQGQPGPTLYGTVAWNAITGQVGEPEAWVASESDGSLTITVWEPSFYGDFHGYYGIQSGWYPSTIAAGQQGLSMIIPSLPGQTLAQIAANPSP